MLRVIKFVLIILLFTCCNHAKQKIEKEREIEIGSIEISVPATINFIKGQGVDSYVAYLVNKKKDTFHIEYGRPNIIYNLFDLPPKALPEKDKEGLQKNLGKLPSPDEAIFSRSPEQDNLQDIFQDNFYLYDTINNITVKIVQPKRIGRGKTGLYIPELRDGNSFSIYASNLDSVSQWEALQMFKTIKYK
jgi:hypothetical protein